MTITTALILLVVTIIGVGVALAGVLIPAINGLRQQVNHEIAGLRQEINQQGQQITQIAQQVGHLSGLLEGLRGRPISTEHPEEIRV